MQLTIPVVLEAWIGGYVGPSYRISLKGDLVTYEVFDEGYALHCKEEFRPEPAQWRLFLRQIEEIGLWSWASEYRLPSGEIGDSATETSWSLSINLGFRDLTSRGEGTFAPGFVEYLRAVRELLGGRQFA